MIALSYVKSAYSQKFHQSSDIDIKLQNLVSANSAWGVAKELDSMYNDVSMFYATVLSKTTDYQLRQAMMLFPEYTIDDSHVDDMLIVVGLLLKEILKQE